MTNPTGRWVLVQHSITSADGSCTAALRLRDTDDDGEHYDAAIGDGTLGAVLKVTQRITGVELPATKYVVPAVEIPVDDAAAQETACKVIVVLANSYAGEGRSSDIVQAHVLAVLDACNKAAADGHGFSHGLRQKKRPA